MGLPAAEINYLAVLVAAIAAMIVGYVWYGPAFGKMWLQLIGKKQEDLRKGNMAMMYGITYLIAVVTAYVLAYFIALTSAASLLDGAKVGLYAAVGFVATSTFANDMFNDKPFSLTLLTAGHHIVAFMVMGAILAWWPY